MSNQSVVLITGASSGVGQATARLLSQKGYKVYGTSRNPANAEPIPNVRMLALDVRDDDSVTGCVNSVFGSVGRLDVLINNAGHELAGASEEISLDEAKSQFELNFFGVIRMVKAVLPLMREKNMEGLSTSALYLESLLFPSWVSIPQANLHWKDMPKPCAMK